MTNEGKKTRTPRSRKQAAIPAEPEVQLPDAVVVETIPAAGELDAAPGAGDGFDQATPTMTVDDLVVTRNAADDQPRAGDPGDGAVDAAAIEPPVSAELKAIVEAVIFASPEPLTLKALFKVLESEPREDVERAVAELKRDYRQVRGLQLVEIAGGMQIVTRPDLHEWVRRLFHERKNTRLSVQSLETLAVIAYRQPVTSAEIAEIRGVNTAGVLSTLVERKLIKTAGRKAVVGRPFLYATTKEFLLRFGLNDLTDLPKVDEMADVLGFELPGLLNEALPTDQLLPLGDPGDPVAAEGRPDAPQEASAAIPAEPEPGPEPDPAAGPEPDLASVPDPDPESVPDPDLASVPDPDPDRS